MNRMKHLWLFLFFIPLVLGIEYRPGQRLSYENVSNVSGNGCELHGEHAYIKGDIRPGQYYCSVTFTEYQSDISGNAGGGRRLTKLTPLTQFVKEIRQPLSFTVKGNTETVYKDKVIEKKIEVPVEKIVYVNQTVSQKSEPKQPGKILIYVWLIMLIAGVVLACYLAYKRYS